MGVAEEINMVNKDFPHYLTEKCFKKHWCLAVSHGPGGFRKRREACRIHVHLSWYLTDFMVLSYGQKTPDDFYCSVNGMFCLISGLHSARGVFINRG